MKQPTTSIIPTTSGLQRRFLARGFMLAMAALLAAHAEAQTAEPAAAASAPASTPASPVPKAVTYYDPKDLERAFKFMDKTGDGKVSRDEASNFRGVSKHFDEADTNKDGFLSREEFDNAMNKSKQP
jgi:hypothetical protein